MTSIGVRVLLLIAIASTIGCDRVTKHIAATAFAEAPRHSFLADTVRLEYAENAGAFLGMGADWPPPLRMAVFSVSTGLLLTALVLFALRRRWSGAALFGVALVVAGGASNLLDRIAYGVVIDFLNVGVGALRTGIFNVADMAIMIGAAIILISALHRPGLAGR